jgi:hypothetical protein
MHDFLGRLSNVLADLIFVVNLFPLGDDDDYVLIAVKSFFD